MCPLFEECCAGIDNNTQTTSVVMISILSIEENIQHLNLGLKARYVKHLYVNPGDVGADAFIIAVACVSNILYTGSHY